MRQNHFLVSIKTVDDTPVFPESFNGDNSLFQAVAQAMNRAGVISKGFASFPTGFEAVICCKHDMEARMFADAVANHIYEKNNSMGHIIESFGIHIGKLTDDERTLHAVMMDMMMRSMAARGINMDDIPVIEMDMDNKDSCGSCVPSQRGENFDKRCRDFRLWQNRGISEILGRGRLSLQTS